MTTAMQSVPSFADVQAAAQRLEGVAFRTPLVRSAALDAQVGGSVLFKAETLQRTGSFKFRGAYNAISGIPEAERSRGIVACSSGNHAQGIAAAAALYGVPATIVMPSDAPRLKRQRTESYGARVVDYDRATGDRDAIAAAIVSDTGGVFVAPYDNAGVISGQGTTGLELVRQADEMGLLPDIVLVPCGGGGLTAGLALAVKSLLPDTEVITVEPEGFDDHARSFRSGNREHNQAKAGSICDALMAHQPGELTFELNRSRVTRGLAVSDAEAMAAVAYAWRELKLVVEPGGAVGLAAILAGKADTAGRTVAVVLSGGNADPEVYARAVGAAGPD
ncbi:threonine/serine dehydratase [Microbaculum marinum]|uniref:Threonine/serine dehydratase n=1 Tax=Microbaculum marinum TaxID=1764581 RepID=A0AAW9RE69_9HYPH